MTPRATAHVSLVALTPQEATRVEHWFDHPEVVRRLGPRSWIHRAAAMLDAPVEDETFLGRRVLRARGWVGLDPHGSPVGYIGGDVYDGWTWVDGPDSDQVRVVEVDQRTSMGLAYVVDPARWGQGWGAALIAAAVTHGDVSDVAAFYLGIEEDNVASWRAASRAGFTRASAAPDHGGIVYWRREHQASPNRPTAKGPDSDGPTQWAGGGRNNRNHRDR